MTGYRPQKRGGAHDHYANGRSQKYARSDNPNSAAVAPRRPYDNAHHSSNNSPSYPAPQVGPRTNAQRKGETVYFEHVDRLPDPSKCEPCKLAKEELDVGLIVLLAQVEAEETTPEGDREILRCAGELRRLLSARITKKHTKRMKELDKARPSEGKYVMVPEYIEHRLEKAKDLPPLPPIEPSLQAQVFTHSSVHDKAGRIKGVTSTDELSYERLEFVGDAYLELMATRLIAHRLPHIDVPAQAHFREQLVRNDTLSKFSRGYGLPDRLKHSHILLEEGKAWDKITADVFEAYVAAVVYSDPVDGFLTAEKWMNQLWAEQMLSYRPPILVENVKAQEELKKLIHMNHIKITYVDEKNMENTVDGVQQFLQGVYLTGWGYDNEWLGSGYGRNKSQAAMNAAQDALTRNSHVLQMAAKEKQKFLAVQQAERDQKREELRKQAREGDKEAVAELRRLLQNDIRVKKKQVARGDEDAAARLEELIAEETALAEKFDAKGAEDDGAHHSAFPGILTRTHVDDVVQNDAADEGDTSTTKKHIKQKDPKPKDPKPRKEVKQSAEDFLANIIAGGKGDANSSRDPKWLEREQKRKEKEERKKHKRAY